MTATLWILGAMALLATGILYILCAATKLGSWDDNTDR